MASPKQHLVPLLAACLVTGVACSPSDVASPPAIDRVVDDAETSTGSADGDADGDADVDADGAEAGPPDAGEVVSEKPAEGPSPAAQALIDRLIQDKKELDTSGATREAMDEVAREFLAALSGDDAEAHREYLLTEDEIQHFYTGAIAGIMLSSRNAPLEKSYEKFRIQDWSDPGITVESHDAIIHDPGGDGGATHFQRKVAMIAEVKLTSADRRHELRLQHCIFTARGWRFVRFEVR